MRRKQPAERASRCLVKRRAVGVSGCLCARTVARLEMVVKTRRDRAPVIRPPFRPFRPSHRDAVLWHSCSRESMRPSSPKDFQGHLGPD